MNIGKLTTHVLDIAEGRPAGGIRIQLYRVVSGSLKLLCDNVTNQDGRLDKPLLAADEMIPGIYELQFFAGDYWTERRFQPNQKPTVWDRIVIRFTVEKAEEHYHIPLVIAPGGYSTYRGS